MAPRSMPSKAAIEERERIVLHELARVPRLRVGDLAEALGMDRDSTSHLLRRMGHQGKLRKVGARAGPKVMWELASREPVVESRRNAGHPIADPARSIAARAVLLQADMEIEHAVDKLREWT